MTEWLTGNSDLLWPWSSVAVAIGWFLVIHLGLFLIGHLIVLAIGPENSSAAQAWSAIHIAYRIASAILIVGAVVLLGPLKGAFVFVGTLVVVRLVALLFRLASRNSMQPGSAIG